jgi:hypothetical protein
VSYRKVLFHRLRPTRKGSSGLAHPLVSAMMAVRLEAPPSSPERRNAARTIMAVLYQSALNN